MSIKDKIVWSTYRRFKLMKEIKGFHAHRSSYASKKSKFSDYSHLLEGALVFNSNVGRFTRINGATLINVDIGSFSSIAARCIIGGGGEHPLNQVSTHSVFYKASKQQHPKFRFSAKEKYNDNIKKVVIGNDVWIGSDVIVKQGIRIADGAVIATGSIVVKDVPPFAIVGGVPAKIIKYRHTEELRNSLLESKWWDWSINSLQVISDEFDQYYPLDLKKFEEIKMKASKF